MKLTSKKTDMYKKYQISKRYLLILVLIQFYGNVVSEELPRATTSNCFYIMPLFEEIRVPGSVTYQQKSAEFIKMKAQLGVGNLYHRLGFSFIHSPNVEADVRENCKLAAENGLHIGLIFALQSHTRESAFKAVASTDLRQYQWRKDGIDWKGSFVNTGNLEIPTDLRDYKVPTPSRYATNLRNYNLNAANDWAASVKRLMGEFPNTITCINGPVEEELAVGGYASTQKLADYSPYAITEFRDWIRHAGLYDATTGKYAGEGANKLLIGELININGALRSQFYDDPAPNNSNGTGTSFNEYFGTTFTTWKLRYWDFENYPNPITDESFDCTPESGNGFTMDGFDAPREINPMSLYWITWSYDVNDMGVYPFGNPTNPAYGFRQNLTRNYVRDLFSALVAAGLPKEIMFAHQIPGDCGIGTPYAFTDRARSSASTIWSGYLEKSNTIGITRFGGIDPKLMTQYVNDWGIFEWHTAPNSTPTSQTLYDKSKADLTSFYTNKCHYLFPGWWKKTGTSLDKIFPLNDSKFSQAISDFYSTCKEVPYNRQNENVNFTPPIVSSIRGYLENNTLNVSWSNKIWDDLAPNWSEWRNLLNFEVQKSVDKINWESSVTTNTNKVSQAVSQTTYYVRVRAVSKANLYSTWSEVITVDRNSPKIDFSVSAELNTIDDDPNLMNLITVKLADINQVINADSITLSISGNGTIITTEPLDKNNIEKFWPMNVSTEIQSPFRIDNQIFSGGLYQGTISLIEPIDPYFTIVGSVINPSILNNITIRMYSDIITTGRFYFFHSGGNVSNTFEVQKGWKEYPFLNIPQLTGLTAISSIRFDPSTIAPGKFRIDWLGISSKTISSTLKPVAQINGNTATFYISPNAEGGSCTISVTINGVTKFITVQTNAVSGINQLVQNKKESLLSPNPATNWVSIKNDLSEKMKVSIISLNGQVVKVSEFTDLKNPSIEISDLSKGLYLIKIESKNNSVTEKLIKN